MHARVMTGQIQPGATDEAIRIYRSFVVPVCRQLWGFKSAVLLTDSDTGRGISITLWNREADMKFAEGSIGLQQQFTRFEGVFVELPVTEYYEVGAEAVATVEGGDTRSARVSYAQVQPGKMDEFLGIYRDFIVPAARQEQGFKGILVLTDRNTNKSIVITLWESEADVTASESFGNLQEQRTRLVGVLAGSRVVERHEVSVQV